MFRIAVIGFVALMLGGCITGARQEQQLADAGPKEDGFCRSIGAKPGSDAYVNCRMTMRQELLRSQAQERAERDRSGDAMAGAGAALLAPRPSPFTPVVTCNSNSFAGMTTTTCR